MTSKIKLLCMSAMAMLLLSACGSLNKQAFNGTKTYALVTIACNDTISVSSGNPNGGPSSILGLVQAAGDDTGYSEKAGPVFNAILPDIKREFAKNPHFKLMPERKVLRSKAYRKVKGEDPDGVFIDYLLAKNYKLITDEDVLKQLARDLKVDGVIVVTVNLGYAFSGLHLAGLVSAGSHNAKVIYSVGVIDADGNKLWSDYVDVDSDDSVPALGDAVNFPKLKPLLITTARKGVIDLLAMLDK